MGAGISMSDSTAPSDSARVKSRVAATKRRARAGSRNSMLSIELRGGEERARRFAAATRLFILAESLGAVESLIELPAPMTHASVAESPLAVPDGLLRLSVGIEAVEDLRADLETAFAASAS